MNEHDTLGDARREREADEEKDDDALLFVADRDCDIDLETDALRVAARVPDTDTEALGDCGSTGRSNRQSSSGKRILNKRVWVAHSKSLIQGRKKISRYNIIHEKEFKS